MAQAFFRYDISRDHFLARDVWFRADVSESGSVTLSNRENRFTNARQTIDGRPSTTADVRSGMVLLEPDDWTRPLAMQIVNEAFLPQHVREVHPGDPLQITMMICSQTGEIMEVNFRFHRRSGYATVPPNIFWRIEQALKEQLRFTPTADGRRLNFIARTWMHELVPAPRPERRNRLPPPPPIPIPQSPPPPSSPPPPPPSPPHGPPGGGNNQPPQTEIGGEWRP